MIARLTGLLLAFVVLMVVIGLGALSSTAGNRLIVQLAEDALAPDLSVGGVTGSVLSELCAQSVRYQTSDLAVLVEDVCVNPRLWASIDFIKVDLSQLRAGRLEITTFDAEGTEEVGPRSLTLPVDVSVEQLSVGEMAVNGIDIADLDLTLNLSDADLAGSGTLTYDSAPVAVSTTGSWSTLQIGIDAYGARLDAQLNLPDRNLPWQARLTSTSLELAPFTDRSTLLQSLVVEGDGNLSRYRLKVTGRLQDALLDGAFSVVGDGGLTGITLEQLDLTYVALHEYPARIDLLQSSGVLGWEHGVELMLDELRFSGSVAEQPIDASADALRLDPDAVELGNLVATLAGSSRLTLDGRIGFGGDLDLNVDARSVPLTLADERLAGQATLQASLQGTTTAPAFIGDGRIDGLAWQSELIGDLRILTEGSPQAGRGTLQLTSERGEATVQLSFEERDSGYELRILDAVVFSAALDARATLIEPVDLLVGPDIYRFADACISLSVEQIEAEPGRLCADLDYPAGGLRLELAPWKTPELPLPNSEISVVGELGLALALDGFAPLEGTAALSLEQLVATHPDLDPLLLGDLQAAITITDKQLKATLASPPDGSQELLFNGALISRLPDAPLASPLDSPVEGSVYMALDGIWVAQSLLPMDVAYELENVRGLMAVNAVVSGTLGKPVVDGSLKLSDAGWQVLAVNADFDQLEATASIKGSERIDFSSTAAVGAGSLFLEGDIAALDTSSPTLTTVLSLQEAELLNLPDYQATVDGALEMTMGTETLRLQGALHLPRASLLIADLPETAVTASADEVFVDEVQEDRAQQVRYTDVQLTLGDEVYLDAFGLTGRLVGNLRVREEPGRVRTVDGVIGLREARFEAYGQKLAVERGQLTFSGPVDDPAVDLLATRVIDYEGREYRISLLVSGTANDLETEIRSQPLLSEDDALALLLTGRTFSQISSSEQSNVYGAALSMGLLSATGVTQNLANALNLEEIIVDQDSDGNMEVGAALRLNRNLYLRYTYGVFSRLGGVLLRYRFSNRFSVQAKTGDAHSIEIRYGVDD